MALRPKQLWRRSLKLFDPPSDSTKPSSSQSNSPMANSTPVTIAIIGYGQRGQGYAQYAQKDPSKCAVVAIAEPRQHARESAAKAHAVDPTLVFSSWQDLHRASAETIGTIGRRLADAVLVAVQDHLHAEVVEAFAAQGYHLLCEKPMATSVDDCLRIEKAVTEAGIIFGMGHVLRYSPYTKAITEIIRSNSLGTLVNAVHVEPIGHWHFAHSYVRGNWSQEAKSSFSLMTKSCHDMDILCHWFSPSAPFRVSSFGSLQQFRKSAKPQEAGEATRCLDCPIKEECPYSAKRVYLDPVTRGTKHWPVSVIVDGVPDIENVTEALRTGPYGRCVYEHDNDVCDHQVVNIEFSDGATASFTMVAQTHLICERQTRLHFTHGELVGDMSTFTVTDFRTRKTTRHSPPSEGGGHGGGDIGLIRAFVEAVRAGDQTLLGTDVAEVLKSHMAVFAAETSRREGRVVDCAQFEDAARKKTGGKTNGVAGH